MAALSLEEAIENALESFPNIDWLKDEQKKCIAALLQKKDVLGYKLVFGSAEMWLRKTWINNFKKSALRNNVELVVVDEAHVAQSW